MDIRVALIFLLASVSCVRSQISLVESGGGVVKPGGSETMTLTCTVSGFSLTSNSVHWIRQPADKGLDWVARMGYDGSTNYSPSIQGRFTVSRDTSQNKVFLRMTNLKAEDTARYHCARDGGYYAFDIWGPGTMVTITSVEKASPSVFPLVPCGGTLDSSSKVHIGCLVKGYFPIPADIKWNSGSITENIKNFPAVRSGQSSLYTSSSQLTVTASEWKSKIFECNVEHKATSTKIDKRIVPERTKLHKPNVQVLQSSCDDRDGNGSIELVCLINDYSPSKIEVQWLLNGKVAALSPITSPAIKDSKGKFTSRSQVNIPKNDWNNGDTYTCQVEHPATTARPTDSIRNCISEPGIQPKVTLIDPSIKDRYVERQPKITCLVTKLESQDSLVITWTLSSGRSSIGTTTSPEYQYDGTMSISSFLTVPSQDWERGDQVSCTVTHNDLSSPVTKNISKKPDDENAPVVYVLPPAQEELRSSETATLTCLVTGFRLSDCYIQWKHRGTVLSEDTFINTEPTHDKIRNDFFRYSKLIIQRTDWNNHDTYICEVFHPAFSNRSIEKSIQKSIVWYYELTCSSEEDGEEDFDNLWTTAATFIVLFLLSVFYSAIITLVKVKWFISRIMQYEQENDQFITVLDQQS